MMGNSIIDLSKTTLQEVQEDRFCPTLSGSSWGSVEVVEENSTPSLERQLRTWVAEVLITLQVRGFDNSCACQVEC